MPKPAKCPSCGHKEEFDCQPVIPANMPCGLFQSILFIKCSECGAVVGTIPIPLPKEAT